MPQLPQMPIRHDQRNDRVPSSWSLMWLRPSRTVQSFRSGTSYSCQCGSRVGRRAGIGTPAAVMVCSPPWRSPPVDPLARGPAGDGHRQVLDPRRARRDCGAPASGPGSARRRGPGSRCAGARRGTPRAAGRPGGCTRPMSSMLASSSAASELGVERAARVREADVPDALLQLGEGVRALGHGWSRSGRCRRPPP